MNSYQNSYDNNDYMRPGAPTQDLFPSQNNIASMRENQYNHAQNQQQANMQLPMMQSASGLKNFMSYSDHKDTSTYGPYVPMHNEGSLLFQKDDAINQAPVPERQPVVNYPTAVSKQMNKLPPVPASNNHVKMAVKHDEQNNAFLCPACGQLGVSACGCKDRVITCMKGHSWQIVNGMKVPATHTVS